MDGLALALKSGTPDNSAADFGLKQQQQLTGLRGQAA